MRPKPPIIIIIIIIMFYGDNILPCGIRLDHVSNTEFHRTIFCDHKTNFSIHAHVWCVFRVPVSSPTLTLRVHPPVYVCLCVVGGRPPDVGEHSPNSHGDTARQGPKRRGEDQSGAAGTAGVAVSRRRLAPVGLMDVERWKDTSSGGGGGRGGTGHWGR